MRSCRDGLPGTEVLLREILLLLEGLGPLSSGCRIDAGGILQAAARRLGLDSGVLSEAVRAGLLDRELDRALAAGASGRAPESGGPPSGLSRTPEEWMEGLWNALVGADGPAVEVLRLRVEGWELREISERTGLGWRRVRRLLARIAQSRAGVNSPC